MKPRNNISSACRHLCFNAHMSRCINGAHVNTYKLVYIQNIFHEYDNLSTVVILHCRDSYKPRSKDG